MAKRARAISLKQERELLRRIRLGYPLQEACDYAGVNYTTVRRWLAKGGHDSARNNQYYVPPEEAQPVYRRFAQRYALEEDQISSEMAHRIVQASVKDWRAAAWFLARRYPEEWGRRRENIKPNPVRGTVTIVHTTSDALAVPEVANAAGDATND